MFKNPPQPEPSPSPTPTPARRFTDVAEAAATVIGRGTHVRGELTAEGPVEIGGTIEGPCRIVGLCRVRSGARITGDVTATSLVVEGEITGSSLVADKVEIGVSGRVQADVRARAVAIADGAFLQGHVEMEDLAGSTAPVTFTEKRDTREREP